jgi:hypothetical protein
VTWEWNGVLRTGGPRLAPAGRLSRRGPGLRRRADHRRRSGSHVGRSSSHSQAVKQPLHRSEATPLRRSYAALPPPEATAAPPSPTCCSVGAKKKAPTPRAVRMLCYAGSRVGAEKSMESSRAGGPWGSKAHALEEDVSRRPARERRFPTTSTPFRLPKGSDGGRPLPPGGGGHGRSDFQRAAPLPLLIRPESGQAHISRSHSTAKFSDLGPLPIWLPAGPSDLPCPLKRPMRPIRAIESLEESSQACWSLMPAGGLRGDVPVGRRSCWATAFEAAATETEGSGRRGDCKRKRLRA